MRIGIDAMGNDNGPLPIVQGIKMFLEADHDATVIMVGDRDRVSQAMIEQGIGLSKRLELVHASQVMEMEDKVADLREKRDSSIMRLVGELKEGGIDGMVALGNTAAGLGVEGVNVARAAILGQMTTGFPVSPLTPATFLLVGLAGVDLGDHQKKTIPLAFLVTIVMLIISMLTGGIKI